MMLVDNYKLFMSALVGSHNYNLNDEQSDRDYKYFVFPTFDDLYCKKEIAKSKTSDDLDYEVHDIRKLPQLWWKANINFIEVLFSQDMKYYVEESNELALFLKSNKNALATMNLPYLFDACMGMGIRKQKDMLIDSPARHNNIEKYGYDTKSAYHAIRILDFLPRLINFNLDFGKAIWYDDSFRREILLKVRYGEYILPQIQEMLVMYTANANYVKSIYKEQSKNTSLKDELDEVIKGQCLKYIRAI